MVVNENFVCERELSLQCSLGVSAVYANDTETAATCHTDQGTLTLHCNSLMSSVNNSTADLATKRK